MRLLPFIIGKFYIIIGFGLLIIFIFLIFFHHDSAITQDLGRHLTLGKIIWENKKIPQTNLFSYTYPDFPVIDHHWASQVIFYLLNRSGGINLLILIKALTLSFSILLIAGYTLRRVNFPVFFLISILSIGIFRERTEVRPEIFAYPLFSLTLFILYKEKEKSIRWIYFLPLISFLWSNLHISFIIFPLVYAVFLCDRFLQRKFKIKYFFIGLLSIVSMLINPSGFKGTIYPFNIFQNYGYQIAENQTPFFLEKVMDDPTILFYKISGLLLLTLSPWLMAQKYYFEGIVSLSMLILSSTAIRHFPFFALSLIYPLSFGLSSAVYYLKKVFIKGKSNYLRYEIIFAVILIIILFYEFISLAKSPSKMGFGQSRGIKEAVSFFQNNNLKGPVWNNFDIGSYLIYRLYPGTKVFVDGRPEAYPKGFFKEIYIPMQDKEEVWKEMEKRYGFNTIIFGHTDATPWGRSFINRISKNANWQIVYFDDYGIVLARNRGEDNKNYLNIDEYGRYLIQRTEDRDALLRLANLFQLLEQSQLEKSVTLKIVN